MGMCSDLFCGLSWIQALETLREAGGREPRSADTRAGDWSPRLPVQLRCCLRSTPCKYFQKAYIQMVFIRPD